MNTWIYIFFLALSVIVVGFGFVGTMSMVFNQSIVGEVFRKTSIDHFAHPKFLHICTFLWYTSVKIIAGSYCVTLGHPEFLWILMFEQFTVYIILAVYYVVRIPLKLAK